MPSAKTWVKAVTASVALCIGGPALVMYVTPTEEEIIQRYNPELRKRALETREQRQQEFNEFIMQLKELSKSDKPIWVAQKELELERANAAAQKKRDEQAELAAAVERRRAEIRASTK